MNFENPQSAIRNLQSEERARASALPGWLGPGLAAGALGIALAFATGSLVGMLAAVAAAGGALILAGYHWPVALPMALLLIGPFNYGAQVGGASIKLSEGLTAAMLAVALMRAAAGDAELHRRIRRAAPALAALALLGAMAAITAAPHPNFFNVRYEIEICIASAYTILFFRRAWWPWLLGAALTALALESAAALALKFVFGLTGTNFFNAGGVGLVQLSAEDLQGLAGGSFRLAGTMGHKNMLAALIVLLLPLVALEMLHRGRLLWGLVVAPTLVTLALTDSATGWGAMALIVLLALVHLRRFDYLAFLTLLVLPLAAVGLYKFGDTMFYRLRQLTESPEGWSTIGARFTIWDISQRLLGEYPWMGTGRNNFMFYGKTYFTHAHNLFVMKAIEMGIPAGAAFAAVIIALLARPWRAIAREAGRLGAQRQYYRTLGLWLGCLGFLAMNMFDYSYSNFSLGPIFMMSLGMLLAVALDLEAAETEP